MSTKTEAIKRAILRAADANPNITAKGLTDELERGEVFGWLHLPAVRAGNFADWSGGMQAAAAALLARAGGAA